MKNKFKIYGIAAVFAMSSVWFLVKSINIAPIEIRKVTPPKLESSNLGKRIICYRPMRHGGPNMTIEKIGNKVVAHNYGHGGGGWTLAPGAANYVNDLMLSSTYAEHMTKDSEITIVGGGVIGLYTAYDLYQKGYKNLTIVADKFEDLASHNAGGLLSPASMDNDRHMNKIIYKIGVYAYKFYSSIAINNNHDFKNGAVFMPAYFDDTENSGLEMLVGTVMQPTKEVILDFGNGTTRKMMSYDDCIFIHTFEMMNNLTNYLTNNKVIFKKKKIKNFAEIKSDFIFNCTGLGASQLNDDQNMIPVQGHLIMLKDQPVEDIQYMIISYFGESQNDLGQKINRSMYMFPKHITNTPSNDVGVIGGTFIEGATNATPNIKEFEIVIKQMKEFYGLIEENIS